MKSKTWFGIETDRVAGATSAVSIDISPLFPSKGSFPPLEGLTLNSFWVEYHFKKRNCLTAFGEDNGVLGVFVCALDPIGM